ncbi:MAG: hypothetical protein KC912_06725 [Proteobacteria bacterium]|nr:hypothetical protein [Pseudomonadota bacterium]
MTTGRWVALATAVVLLIASAALFGPLVPYVVDDVRLDGIVRAVALDWRDFGEDEARERLQYELDAQGIDAAVGDESCALNELDGGREVRCEWTVDAKVIWGVLPLSFHSIATMDAEGDLD